MNINENSCLKPRLGINRSHTPWVAGCARQSNPLIDPMVVLTIRVSRVVINFVDYCSSQPPHRVRQYSFINY